MAQQTVVDIRLEQLQRQTALALHGARELSQHLTETLAGDPEPHVLGSRAFNYDVVGRRCVCVPCLVADGLEVVG